MTSRVKAKAKAAEDTRLKLKARVVLPGRDAKLRPKTRNLAGGQTTTLRLRPKGRRAAARVLDAIANGRTVRARLIARFVDEAGNGTRRSLMVRLR